MSKEEETKKVSLDLKDTVNGMCSDDYKERFIAEYTQLKIRQIKLKKFIGKIKYAKYADQPEPKHDCPLHVLEKQEAIMCFYLAALEVRASEYENIQLPKISED